MSSRIAISDHCLEALVDSLGSEHETAGFGVGRVVHHEDLRVVLVSELELVDERHYLERRRDRLTLEPDGWFPRGRDIIKRGLVPVFVHTHPGGNTSFSELDDDVEDIITTVLETDLVSVVVAGGPNAVQLAGRFVSDGIRVDADATRVVGKRLGLHLPNISSEVDVGVHDRTARALGRSGIATLSALVVAVVGAGGTGSPVIEMLARLGVGTIIVIDNDAVSDTTVSRGYGSSTSDIGNSKVDVAASNVARIGLRTRVIAITDDVASEQSRRWLAQADIVFGCTDSHSSRVVLNRLAYDHLIPVIDMGVLVESNDEVVSGIHGRVTWVSPGDPCLHCRGVISPAIAAAEALPPAERVELAREGYVPALDEPAPSVVTYTTLVAATAVSELLNRLFGFGDSTASELLLRVDEHEIRKTTAKKRAGCVCGDPDRWGTGRQQVDLGLVNTA